MGRLSNIQFMGFPWGRICNSGHDSPCARTQRGCHMTGQFAVGRCYTDLPRTVTGWCRRHSSMVFTSPAKRRCIEALRAVCCRASVPCTQWPSCPMPQLGRSWHIDYDVVRGLSEQASSNATTRAMAELKRIRNWREPGAGNVQS